MIELINRLFVRNWMSKLVSLLIAVGVWFTIFSHLEKKNIVPPVPGTADPIPIPKVPTDTAAPPNPLAPSSVIPGN